MLLAILLPFLSFIVRGKVLTGILCLILQITVIGWVPAAIWAALSLNNERANERNEKLIRAVKQSQRQ
ncbi:YqaE/Pmp3 family membrane protein [Chryseobacterium sp. T16E-39]|uniref:YqaE/Pmp3 family membrane protein n=1 Tax=Chryseobacterium sp. T16E-39 TaxID=2015076 RepID=UPI001E637C99|nr:YqaE/Pmp3 family membrane protein [Chryseobacterium sp. T16E-39]